MKHILPLLSLWTLTLGVSSQKTTSTDKSFYNLWCDPEYEDECYFVEEACDPATDTDFNCEYHPALFVEDDIDEGVHKSINQVYFIWCEPSDQDECYFVDAMCDPEIDLDTCEYHPAIFTELDLQEADEGSMGLPMDGDGRNLRSRYYRHRHRRYRRYRHRPYHRYRRHRRYSRYGGY
eukprot:178586_1